MTSYILKFLKKNISFSDTILYINHNYTAYCDRISCKTPFKFLKDLKLLVFPFKARQGHFPLQVEQHKQAEHEQLFSMCFCCRTAQEAGGRNDPIPSTNRLERIFCWRLGPSAIVLHSSTISLLGPESGRVIRDLLAKMC